MKCLLGIRYEAEATLYQKKKIHTQILENVIENNVIIRIIRSMSTRLPAQL